MPFSRLLAGCALAALFSSALAFARDTDDLIGPPQRAAPEDPLSPSVYVLGFSVPGPLGAHGQPFFYPLCSATVVGRRTLVTAAHCLDVLDTYRGPNGASALGVHLGVFPGNDFDGAPESPEEFLRVDARLSSTLRLLDRVRGDVAFVRTERDLPGPPVKMAREGEVPAAGTEFRIYAHGWEGLPSGLLRYSRGFFEDSLAVNRRGVRASYPEVHRREGRLVLPVVAGQRWRVAGGPTFARTDEGWKLFSVNSGLGRVRSGRPAPPRAAQGKVSLEYEPLTSLQNGWCEAALLDLGETP